MSDPDAYAVLGVADTASAATLKRAHRRLVKRHHPDLAPPDRRAEATRQVQALNVAYGLVRDEAHRRSYDALRRVEAASRGHSATWDAAVTEAGRWAGRWWWRNGPRLGAAARRSVLAARSAAGRVLWLLSCAGGTVLGVLLAYGAQNLTGGSGPWSTAAGLFGGLAAGHAHGLGRWRRLAGLASARRPSQLAAAAAVAVLAAVTLLERP